LVALVLLLLGYLGWANRDAARRWIHKMTADKGQVASPGTGATLDRRLDSLTRHLVDSVVLTPGEAEALVLRQVPANVKPKIDSLGAEVGEGTLAVRGQVDGQSIAKELPSAVASALGPHPSITLRGPVQLVRAGQGEWRLEDVLVRGIPVPKAIWGALLEKIGASTQPSVTFTLPPWVSGFRVSGSGVVLYGGKTR
jgi:hypothetical protein